MFHWNKILTVTLAAWNKLNMTITALKQPFGSLSFVHSFWPVTSSRVESSSEASRIAYFMDNGWMFMMDVHRLGTQPRHTPNRKTMQNCQSTIYRDPPSKTIADYSPLLAPAARPRRTHQ